MAEIVEKKILIHTTYLLTSNFEIDGRVVTLKIFFRCVINLIRHHIFTITKGNLKKKYFTHLGAYLNQTLRSLALKINE